MKIEIRFTVENNESEEQLKAMVVNACCDLLKRMPVEELATIFNIYRSYDEIGKIDIPEGPPLRESMFIVSIDTDKIIKK